MEKEGPYKNERKEVARFMRRLYRQGLTTTSGGNISCRITDDIVVITPSATDKGRMKWNEVGIVNINGENLTPGLKPSIELGMHLLIYRKNKHVSAIVHAHPLFATAFTAMTPGINTSLTAEARAVCGDPAFVPYALMGTSDLAEIVSEYISRSDILLLENHGILAAGSSLLQAFDRLEVLENAAKMTLIVEIKGGARPLSKEQISEIDKLFR
ncbi:MAG: class II aldolase/adducin family protein [Bacteroidales bacterium]|jgi:L-fuculose-phosphate aldolase|nr:class II aldolase/adducin family protein [Bacteroidales bacterium]